MLSVSVRQFRVVCVVALVALLLSQFPALGLLSFSKGIMTLSRYEYYAALAPTGIIWGYVVIGFTLIVVGLVGMLNFWRFSRWSLAVALVSALTVRPFLGLAVHPPYETFLATLFGSLVLWLITVSFWTPIAERFTRKAGG